MTEITLPTLKVSRFIDFVKTYPGVKEIDFYLARSITQTLGKPDDELFFFTVLACSQSLREGHSCLQVSEWADGCYWQSETDVNENNSGYQFPNKSDWCQHLNTLSISPAAEHPVVYENCRFYLRRYWLFEDELANAIKRFTRSLPFDQSKAIDTLASLFRFDETAEEKVDEKIDWQMVSAANALGKQFSIVTGGPGTGKTTTVTKLLISLCEVFETAFNIKMAAPTGKAAQRLTESIQFAKNTLQGINGISEVSLSSVPEEATTIHRLLGVIPNHYEFRYNQRNKLTLDILLVDEASMVDLPLMARLFRALPENARVIFLGDSNQLPSVAAGSVLADIAPVPHPGYGAENAQLINKLTGYILPESKDSSIDYLTTLTKSYRFKEDGGIGRLAKSIIEGRSNLSWEQLSQPDNEVSLSTDVNFSIWLNKLVSTFYTSLNKQENALCALSEFSKFRILAATRVGDKGVDSINDAIDLYIKRSLGLPINALFYHACPILIAENNYECGLYNGDIGIIWKHEGRLQAAFPDAFGGLRWFSLSRLPKYELVYAMTIHKTQGSEFSELALVLPDYISPILSRELLYTGVTRARSKLEINSSKKIWAAGVKKKVSRNSGLYDKLFLDSDQMSLL